MDLSSIVPVCNFARTYYASRVQQRRSAPMGFAEAACSNIVQREASSAVAERDSTCRDEANKPRHLSSFRQLQACDIGIA